MKVRVASALVALAIAASGAFGGTVSGVTTAPVANGPKFIAGETTGPDGNVWFAAWKDNEIGRLSPDGSIKLFPLPTPNAVPDQITTGRDGNLWFTEQIGNIGRITPEGAITEFAAGSPVSGPIVTGSDGAVWFKQSTFGPQASTKLGRVASNGTIKMYDLGSSDSFASMAFGPDGRLWLFDGTKNAVVIVSPASGSIAATYPMPTPADPSIGFMHHFIVALDGNMWLTHNNSLVRIKPDGTMTSYAVPTANGVPSGLANGGDGNLWFTEYQAKKLGQLILSTATDSGQATINESDAILGDGSVDLVLLTNSQQRTAATVDALDTANPCQSQTYVSWFTVEGIWVSITWTVPPQKCANMWGTVDIIDGLVATRGSLYNGPKLSFDCTMANSGPDAADGAILNCGGSGVVLNATLTGDPSCTMSTNGVGSILVRSASLPVDQRCTVHGEWSPESGYNSRFAFAASTVFDPNFSNNRDDMDWTPLGGRDFSSPSQTVPAPVKRGSGH